MNCTIKNPWQPQGVSIIPKDLSCLMPLVGQEKLFVRVEKFIEDIVNQGGTGLAGFFTLFGGWGVGKSRVGHEICLEALSEDVEWIVDGKPRRLLETNLQQKILPLFVRYVQVTRGEFGDQLEANNWIPSVVVEALARLAGIRTAADVKSLAKNQDQLMQQTVNLLRPKGWDQWLPELKQALSENDPFKAAHDSIAVLKKMGIESLLLVVDEIEDITDVEQDGLPSEERVGIDQALLTVIPRVIKEEEIRQEFPQVNFVLLCSQAVGDLLKQIRAIERRTGWHELTTNSFADVEAFFQFLTDHRPDVAASIQQYPHGLKETAFFAANRNFGWFNVIMHHVHENLRGRNMTTAELLKNYAEQSVAGHGKSVFDTDAIGSYRIAESDDYDEIVRSMYDLLPKVIDIEKGVSPKKADRFLAMRDQGGEQGPLFARIQEVRPPQKHRILAHLISCGFTNTSGTELMLPGEVRFELQTVLDSLAAYSIGLPKEHRDHYLICEDVAEFTSQISGLSPYSEQANQFASFLHGLLIDPAYSKDENGKSLPQYIAPAFSFLLKFNHLNKSRKREVGYLKDHSQNTKLEEAFKEIQKNSKERAKALLHGMANAWDMDNAPAELLPISKTSLCAAKGTTKLSPLNLGKDNEVIFLFAGTASVTEIEQDLQKLASGATVPIVLILEEKDQVIDDLNARLARNVPKIYPFVIIHNVIKQVADQLVRLGLMGKKYGANDLRTSHFHSVIGAAKEHLKKRLEIWKLEKIESQGYLLQPIFYGGRIRQDEFCAFAKGYAELLSGTSYDDIVQTGSITFNNDTERDQFVKLAAKQADPSAKYRDYPRSKLIVARDGWKEAEVPRGLVSILKNFGPVPLKDIDLERYYLFDMPPEQKGKDVVRNFCTLMQCLGLLERDGDKLVRTSKHQLATWLKRSREWLDGDFVKKVDRIKKVSHDTGEELGRYAKQAKNQLKKAEQKLDELNLDFINKPWEELNVDTAAGVPLYEQELRDALIAIRFVRGVVERVYDPDGLASFRYSPDSLHELEREGASNAYPLWKRTEILTGFFEKLDEDRKKLLVQIDEIADEVARRVPTLPDGQQAFPTQPLTLQLNLFSQELAFSPDSPDRTIMAGGTTMGVNSVGFKLADGKFREALERVEVISADLDRNQPGKLVSVFFQLLLKWETLKKESEDLRRPVDSLLAFFTDADDQVKAAYKLAAIEDDFEDINYQINEGGIREGTDGRETSGRPINQLLDGLQKDLEKLESRPDQLRSEVQDINDSILPSLEELYTKKYRAEIQAVTKIRTVQNKPYPELPNTLLETYGATVAAFDSCIKAMLDEGESFFADETETTFAIFVNFCRMEAEDEVIDWSSSEYTNHVQALMRKQLLRLKLV